MDMDTDSAGSSRPFLLMVLLMLLASVLLLLFAFVTTAASHADMIAFMDELRMRWSGMWHL